MPFTIRIATSADLKIITDIFRDTIVAINARDYAAEQIDLWASGANDDEKWLSRIKEHYFVVAQEKEVVVGWAYLSNGNYFDGLYVHKDHQGRGIASLLLEHLETKAINDGYATMDSDVSITALPFFEKHDYKIIRKQQKEHRGLIFENFIVEKKLV